MSPRGRPKKDMSPLNIGKAALTTENAEPKEDLEKVQELVEKVEEKKEKKDFLNYCGYCNKKLDAWVAANGIRFCSDNCVKEFFK